MTSYQESDSASRRDQSKSTFGCLIPLIASTVILAIAVTLVSWFVLSDDDEEFGGSDDEVAAPVDASRAPLTTEELLEGYAPDNQGASSQALLEVVRSGSWKEFGQPETIDLGSQLSVQQKFRRTDAAPRKDEHIQITIHSLKSVDAAQTILEQTKLPARAVQFDHKVVVIEPITDASKPKIDPLADRLRRFRDLLDERDTHE